MLDIVDHYEVEIAAAAVGNSLDSRNFSREEEKISGESTPSPKKVDEEPLLDAENLSFNVNQNVDMIVEEVKDDITEVK